MRRVGYLLIVALFGLTSWPEAPLGAPMEPATILRRMVHAYDRVQDYTTLFLKRERIKGTLQPLEIIELRFQEPFKLYMAWRKPHQGRVVTYVEGENNNKIRVKPSGALGFLRLSLDPLSALATRNAHHSILHVGLQKTIEFLMEQYRLASEEGHWTLHFRGDGEVDNRPAYRLEFVCQTGKTGACYAYRGEIWVDQTSYMPTKLHIYNWDNQEWP